MLAIIVVLGIVIKPLPADYWEKKGSSTETTEIKEEPKEEKEVVEEKPEEKAKSE